MTPPSEPPPRRVPDVTASLIRTWVPIAAGGVLTWVAARSDFAISAETSASVGAFAAMGTAAGYYGLARLLESTTRLRGVGRWMLGGVVSRPSYLSEDECARLEAAARVTPPGV
jgi:hypothetical protein